MNKPLETNEAFFQEDQFKHTKHMYGLKDLKTGQIHGAPFIHYGEGDAIRAFSDAVNTGQKDSLIAMHPEDYELFFLGYFEPSTGVLHENIPQSVITGDKLVVVAE